jgi:hypothetical protein
MNRIRLLGFLGTIALATLTVAAPRRAAAQAYDPSSGPAALQDDGTAADPAAYLGTLEGSGTLTPVGGERQVLEINQPLGSGDRVWLERDARAELVLPDGGEVRVDGGTDLTFGNSGDAADTGDALRLDAGSVQVVTDQGGDHGRGVRLDTENATAYLDGGGRYLVETDRSGWTRVVVREGSAEVMTERGSRRLQAGDETQIDGDVDARIAVYDAGGWSSIERWGGRLDDQARRAAVRYVDPSLRYAAAPLAYNGSWLSIDGGYAWQPRVASTWRPYWNGRWTMTGGGLTWISREPWGWVTSHYGNWDYRPGYGWVWFPGVRYAPAWVYWYWGPTHVGWCPTGYYSHYYGPSYYGGGIRLGVYGWASGWGGFLDWNFVPLRYLGASGLDRYCRRGSDLRAELRLEALPRGVITTDTRGARGWTRPEDVVRDWQVRAGRTRPDLPDVSSFIDRRRDLDPRVRGQISSIGGQPIQFLGGPRDHSTPRQQPWARQRPVERGGEGAVSGSDSGAVARREQAPRDADRSRAWAARLPAPVDGQGQQPTNGARDWRSSRSISSGTAPVDRWRGGAPSRATQPAVRDWRRQPVGHGDQPARERDVRASDPRLRENGSPAAGRGNEAPPIRRIVEGVRQPTASGPPPRTSEVTRHDNGPQDGDRGNHSAKSTRSHDGDREHKENHDGGGPPPPR